MSDKDKLPSTPVQQPSGLSRKRTLKTFYDQQNFVAVKQEPKDDSNVAVAHTSITHLVPPPSPMTIGSVRVTPARVSTIDLLDQAMVQSQHQRPATPSMPVTPRTSGAASQTSAATATTMSAADRATQRSSIDERKFYADYYSQVQKWLALAHIARNFIATAVNAETAVDLARSDETKPPH